MTSASELFYNRRWRAGRREQPELGLLRHAPQEQNPDLLRHRHRHRGVRRGCLGREDPGQSWRQSHAGRISDRLAPTEIDWVWLENRTFGEQAMDDSNFVGPLGRGMDRFKYHARERLPLVVVQARARLLERLRGISSSDRPTHTTSRNSVNELGHGNGIQNFSYRVSDNQNLLDTLESDPLSTNSSVGIDGGLYSLTEKKHQELSWGDLCNVHLEVYRDGTECDYTRKVSPECSICLETFQEGDELNRLQCGHRFHFSCLLPWLRTSRACPYCRRKI